MADAGGPVVVRVVAVITNAVSGLDLNLGVTGNGAYVVVIREVVQCALECSESQANRFFKSNQKSGKRSGPGAARTILLFHIISARPPKQSRMVRTFLKVHTRPRLAYPLRYRGY
jgi:hypothetical protein